MKKLLLAIVSLFLFSTSVFAAGINIEWDTVPNADGYVLSQSNDNGVIWSTPLDVGNVTTYLYNVPDNGLILVRVGAYNSMGTTWRLNAGIFYNGDWTPLPPPSGIGIQ